MNDYIETNDLQSKTNPSISKISPTSVSYTTEADYLLPYLLDELRTHKNLSYPSFFWFQEIGTPKCYFTAVYDIETNQLNLSADFRIHVIGGGDEMTKLDVPIPEHIKEKIIEDIQNYYEKHTSLSLSDFLDTSYTPSLADQIQEAKSEVNEPVNEGKAKDLEI